MKTPSVRKSKLELRRKRTAIPKIKVPLTKEEKPLEEEKSREEEDIVHIAPSKQGEDLLELNQENLLTLWNRFVEVKVPKEKKSLISLLPAITPLIAQDNLKVVFQSEQQQQMFEEIRPNVLGYINSFIKDKFTSIVVEIDDSVKLGIDKPYTPQEQFEHMLEKSPELKEAVDKLNLRLK